MTYGICLYMSVPMRAENSHTSEMVSQLLFGETYQVLKNSDEWVKVCTSDCQYEGWISLKQHSDLSEKAFLQYKESPKYFVKELFLYIRESISNISFPIFIGSQFPLPENGCFTLADKHFHVELPTSTNVIQHPSLDRKQEELLSFALKYANAPYLWGGRTPAGIDCSGFVQIVFKSLGIQLPRDASQQVNLGEIVYFVEEAQIGDVAFFENEEGHIIHTGIICGRHQILHASGHVQINAIDETGIYHQELGKYTHQLRIIKRILGK